MFIYHYNTKTYKNVIELKQILIYIIQETWYLYQLGWAMNINDLTRELEKLKIENDENKNKLMYEQSKRLLAEKTLAEIRDLFKWLPVYLVILN